ncbi:hypothetical protein BJX64DRAFT_263745 [Aspergillus heterothallicus]
MVAYFNVYCALCSCCLVDSIQIGSSSPRHLTIRRAQVARRTYYRSIGSIYYETDDETEEEKDERLKQMPWLREAAEADDGLDTDSLAGEMDEPSYDPDVLGLSRSDLRWLYEIVALGIATDRPPGEKEYFISECEYDDRNVIYIDNSQSSVDIGTRRYFAYGVSDLPDPPVFPMHKACLDLLSRALFGVVNVDRIQKDILYDVMHDLTDFCKLDLNYGDITGADQDWQCVPGEEYSIIPPTDDLDLAEDVRSEVAGKSIFERGAQTSRLDLRGKVVRDPFANLPYDVTYYILQYLPSESVLALNRASWTIFARTRNNSFWKRRLAQDMPWVWEIRPFLDAQEEGNERTQEKIDSKLMYIRLEKQTRPVYGMSGPYMGLANRRRIWGPCSELAERYHARLRKLKEGGEGAGPEVA